MPVWRLHPCESLCGWKRWDVMMDALQIITDQLFRFLAASTATAALAVIVLNIQQLHPRIAWRYALIVFSLFAAWRWFLFASSYIDDAVVGDELRTLGLVINLGNQSFATLLSVVVAVLAFASRRSGGGRRHD